MKHLYSFNENRANRRNFFKNIIGSLDNIIEGIFRFKLLNDSFIHKIVLDTTGVNIDNKTKYSEKENDYTSTFLPTVSIFRNVSDGRGSYKIVYEFGKSYDDDLDGICLCISDMGHVNEFDTKSNYGIYTHFSISFSLNIDREGYVSRIDSKLFYRYPYNNQYIMDVSDAVVDFYKDYKNINFEFLLDVVNKTYSKFISKVHKNSDRSMQECNKFNEYLYSKLMDIIDGSNEKINIIKDKYPIVYLGLKNKFYKNTEIEDSDSMIDMGFAD